MPLSQLTRTVYAANNNVQDNFHLHFFALVGATGEIGLPTQC